jgi:hypothetical protein
VISSSIRVATSSRSLRTSSSGRSFGIGKVPVDVPLAGDDRAGVVASRDDDVGPLNTFVIELCRYVVGGVDADFLEGFKHDWMCGLAGIASC